METLQLLARQAVLTLEYMLMPILFGILYGTARFLFPEVDPAGIILWSATFCFFTAWWLAGMDMKRRDR